MKNYKYYNPNPVAPLRTKKDGTPMKWDRGDCTLRAVCKATGNDWLTVYDRLCEIARENFRMPNSTEVVEIYLKECGFERCSMSYKAGHSKMTAGEFADRHKDWVCVLRLANHLTCSAEGFVHDVWDCREYTVYLYWKKIK